MDEVLKLAGGDDQAVSRDNFDDAIFHINPNFEQGDAVCHAASPVKYTEVCTMNRSFDLLSLGEVLLRLSPPSNERLVRGETLQKQVGGAELNVVSVFLFSGSGPESSPNSPQTI